MGDRPAWMGLDAKRRAVADAERALGDAVLRLLGGNGRELAEVKRRGAELARLRIAAGLPVEGVAKLGPLTPVKVLDTPNAYMRAAGARGAKAKASSKNQRCTKCGLPGHNARRCTFSRW